MGGFKVREAAYDVDPARTVLVAGGADVPPASGASEHRNGSELRLVRPDYSRLVVCPVCGVETATAATAPRCPKCTIPAVERPDGLVCGNPSPKMVTVVYSVLTGERITPLYGPQPG